MNANLYGRSILIGREQEQSRLYVTVLIDGKPFTYPYGQPGSVPKSVSRCQPTEGIAHCRLDIDSNGSIMLTNLKAQNITCVEGNEISKKKISEYSSVTLGHVGYMLNLPQVLEIASKIVAKVVGTVKPPVKEYCINHLQKVWNAYKEQLKEIKKHNEIRTLLWSLPMILSILLSRFLVRDEMNKNIVTIILLIPLLAVLFRFFFIKTRNDSESEELNHYLIDNYVCPNPDCNQFLGNIDFYALKKKKKCPYCGCKFTSNVD